VSNRAAWLTPTRLSLSTFRPIFAFGLPLCVSYLAVIASRRWDNLIVTRVYGPAVAGLYNLAYNLADVPALQVAEQIGDVFMPSLSHLSPDERKSAAVRVAGLLAILVFPLAIGLGAVATTIESAFGASWAGLGPMLAILSAMSISRPLAVSIVGPYLQVTGHTRVGMILGLAQAVLILGALVTIGTRSPLWACAAVGVAFAAHALACLAALRIFVGIRIARVLWRCVPPLVASVPMVVAILALRHATRTLVAPVAVRLAVELVVGAASYVGSAFVVARPLARELIDTVSSGIRGPVGTSSGVGENADVN
jgi:lipopolysaccharide exporter